MKSNTILKQAVRLLEDAVEVAITLKVTESKRPTKRVVLERLQKDLQGIRSLLWELHARFAANSDDCRQSWKLFDELFLKLTEYVWYLAKALLFCKLFSLRRVGRYSMYIGKTIRLLRITAELKQKELAKKLGVSANYLSAVENDKREPSLALLKALSRELNVPVGFLFIESVDEFRNMPKEEKEKYQRIKDLLFEIQKLRIKYAPSKATVTHE